MDTNVVAGIDDPGLAFESGINDAGYSNLRLFDGIILLPWPQLFILRSATENGCEPSS
jgi:hypothetical protein